MTESSVAEISSQARASFSEKRRSSRIVRSRSFQIPSELPSGPSWRWAGSTGISRRP